MSDRILIITKHKVKMRAKAMERRCTSHLVMEMYDRTEIDNLNSYGSILTETYIHGYILLG